MRRLGRTGRILAVVGATLCDPGLPCAMSPDHLEPVELSHTLDVGFGNSIFVGGSIPELGGGNITRAPKLVYTAGAVWRAPIALPAGTTVDYRFYNRTDSAGTVGSTANGTAITTTQSVVVPAGSPPHLPAMKTLVYHSGWTSPALEVESAPGIYTSYPMDNVGAGRGPGEARWRAQGFGTPGRAVRFRVTDGQGNYDYAPGGVPYETFLDTAMLQDGHLFSYEPAPSVSASRIETIASVASPQGLQSRSFRVYLPRGYDEHTTRAYPVLFMHDGQNIYGTTGPGFPPVRWNVDGALDRMIRHGQARELIVVGMDNTSARLQEYTPPGAPMGGLSGGTGDVYLDFVRDTAFPLINSRYRITSNSADWGTAGSSLGGIISTYFGLEEPGIFKKVGAFSPAYWVNTNVVSRLTTDDPLPPWRHYMDSGTAGSSSDGFNLTVEARDRLLLRGQALNRDVLHVVGFGEEHNEQAWQNRFPQMVRFLYPAEDDPPAVNLSNDESAIINWPLY